MYYVHYVNTINVQNAIVQSLKYLMKRDQQENRLFEEIDQLMFYRKNNIYHKLKEFAFHLSYVKHWALIIVECSEDKYLRY